MNRALVFLTAGLVAVLMAVSCVFRINGNGFAWVGDCTEEGIDHVEVREVGPFRALSSSLPANVYYVQADKQEVRVESTEEFASKVLTTVEGGKLSLKLENGRYPRLILRVFVSSPDIESLQVSGSGSLFHEGVLHASGNLALKVSGSGDMQVGSIDSKDFSARSSGSGDIRIEGLTCKDFDGSISGSGTMRLGSLSCEGFDTSVSGSGDLFVGKVTSKGSASAQVAGSGNIRLNEMTVDGNMDLKSSGSGNITVHGSCHDVTATTSGSGNISGNLTHTGLRTRTTGSGEVRL